MKPRRISVSPRGKAALRLLVSLLLLYALLRRLDWLRLVALLQQARWGWMIPAVGLLALGFGLSALRWRAVLRDLGLNEPLSRLLYWNLLAFFWSQFLPTTVGGDGYRVLRLLRRYPERKADALTSVFLDRLYGYLALLSVHGALLPWTVSLWFRQPWLRGVEGILGGGILVGGGLLAWGRGRGWRRLFLSYRWLRPWLRHVAAILRKVWQRSPQTVAWAWGYSAWFVLANGVMRWCYLRVVGADAPLLPVLYASTLAAVLGALPVTLNGLGLTETALVVALTPVGLSPESVLLSAFLLRAVNLSVGLLGGVLYTVEGARFTAANTTRSR